MSRGTPVGLHLLLALLLVTGLAVGSCTGGTDPPRSDRDDAESGGTVSTDTETGEGSGAATAGPAPAYDARDCPEDITAALVGDVSCGVLTVPADRARGRGTVELFVSSLRPAEERSPDPMVVVGGDLGTHLNYSAIAPLAERTGRRVILLDQRGTGHSKPSLDCPAMDAAVDWRDRTGSPRWRARISAAVERCHRVLERRDVDVAAYDVAAMAADVTDLLDVLEIEQANLVTYGSSSRVVLELLRTAPESVRAVIMDTPDLPGVDPRRYAATAARTGIVRVLRWCGRDARCRSAYPDPTTLLGRALAAVSRRPLLVETRLPEGRREVPLDAALLVRVARQAVTDGGSAGTWGLPQAVPAILYAAAEGDQTTLADALGSLLPDQGPLCPGYRGKCMSAHVVEQGTVHTVLCRDVAPFAGLARPTGAGAGFHRVYDRSWWWDVCAHWPVPPAPSSSAERVRSDVPALILVGGLGSPTPVDVVREQTRGLTRSSIVVVPTEAHNVMGSDCTVRVRNAWVDDLEEVRGRPGCTADRLRWSAADVAPAAPATPPSPSASGAPGGARPVAAPVPAAVRGTWLIRRTRQQIRTDLERSGFGRYVERFLAAEGIGRSVTVALTFEEDRFEIAWRGGDGSWQVGWWGAARREGRHLVIRDGEVQIEDTFTWAVRDGALRLRFQGTTGTFVHGIPSEAYSRAYFSRPIPAADCGPADLEACL